MSEKVEKQVEACPFVNPFCVVPTKPRVLDISPRLIKRLQEVKVDPETLETYAVYEDVDLQAEIDARINDCGFTYMQTLLRTGQAKPSDFADDGMHGIDATVIPETVHDAHRLAEENNAQLQELAKALGLQDGDVLTQDMIERKLTEKVQALYEAQKAQAEAAAGGEEK